MNTLIGYLYRDASNYKRWNEVVVSGEASEADKKFISDALDVDGLFVPEKVGLPLLIPSDEYSEDDHCFAELSIDDIRLTDDEPTIDLSWEDVMDGFWDAKVHGWDDVILRQL